MLDIITRKTELLVIYGKEDIKVLSVQQDSYYLSLLKYIEANALRAKLVRQAQNWHYGSLYERVTKSRELLDPPYIELQENWQEYINQPIKTQTLELIRNSVNRQAPLGAKDWQSKIADELGLSSTINQRGRPKSIKNDELK